MKYYVRVPRNTDVSTGNGKYLVVEGDTLENAIDGSMKKIILSLFGDEGESVLKYPKQGTINERVDNFIDFSGKKKQTKKYIVSFACRVKNGWAKGSPKYEEYFKTYETVAYEYAY